MDARALHDVIDGADQADQVINGTIALLHADARVFALPFEFVEDRVLRLLAPVE